MAPSVVTGAGLALLLGARAIAGAEIAAAALPIDFSKSDYFPLTKSKIGIGRALSTSAILDSLPYMDRVRPALYDGELRFPDTNYTSLTPYPFEVAESGTVTVSSNDFLEKLFAGLTERNIEIMIQLEGGPKQWWDYEGDCRPHLFPIPTNLTAAAAAIGKWTKLYAKWPVSWCMWNEPSHTLVGAPNSTAVQQMTDIYDAYASAIAPQGLFGFASFITQSLFKQPTLNGRTHLQASLNALRERRKTKPELPFHYLTLNNYGEELLPLITASRNALGTGMNTVPVVQAQFGVSKPVDWEKKAGIAEEAVLSMKSLERALRIPDLQTFTFAGWIPHMVAFRGERVLEMPLLHALQLFSRMPDRRVVVPDGLPEVVGAMAGGDEERATIMIWNESKQNKTVNVQLSQLQNVGAAGELRVYHIDAAHGSPLEGGADFAPTETVAQDKIPASLSKSVTVAGPGIAYIEIGKTTAHPVLDRKGLGARFVRKHTYADRQPGSGDAGNVVVRGSAYGHYDTVRAVAYTGVKGGVGTALVGAEYRDLPDKLAIAVTASNLTSQATDNKEALLGIRVDYLVAGKWAKSVLWRGDVFDAGRMAALPWGKRGATADAVVAESALNRANAGKSTLTLELAKNAPDGWAGAERRAIVTFWMDSTGAGSQARFVLG